MQLSTLGSITLEMKPKWVLYLANRVGKRRLEQERGTFTGTVEAEAPKTALRAKSQPVAKIEVDNL